MSDFDLLKAGGMQLPGKNLVEQLLHGGLDNAVPITRLLRVGRLAASRLKIANLVEFFDHEENGYEDRLAAPTYRQLPGDLQWQHPSNGWVSIPISETMAYCNAVSEVDAIIATQQNFIHIGADFGGPVNEVLQLGYVPQTRFVVSRSAMVGIVEGVRNRLYKWAVELDSAGVHGEGLSFSASDVTKAQTVSYTNIFYGPVGGVVQGNGSIGDVNQGTSNVE